MNKALEYFDDMVKSNQLDYGDEKPKCDLIRNQLLGIKCFKIIEQELGFSLDIAFRALKKGIYIEKGKFPYTSFTKYDIRGIKLDGLLVISEYGYADCDFTCDYKDYKKTWWLKEDRSE